MAEEFGRDEFERLRRSIKREVEINPVITKFMIFLAFAVPIAILLYALYINYLPFGYARNYELTINEEGIISPISNEIYLTDTNGRKLSGLPDGVKGQVNVIIEPGVVLKDAKVDIEIVGDEGVFLGTLSETDLSQIDWDYSWDFTNQTPPNLTGNAKFNEEQDCVYFDAAKEQTLSLPSSKDMFESEPMSIYVKWKPSETSRLLGNYQQIIGHHNWEIWQGEKNIQFRVGRMNNAQGMAYSTNYPITSGFFGQEHELLAIYSPDPVDGKGYIELLVDNQFAQRVSIGSDIIYKDYNGNKNLNFGRTPHNSGRYPYYDGCIYEEKILNEAIIGGGRTSGTILVNGSKLSIPIIGEGNLKYIKISVAR